MVEINKGDRFRLCFFPSPSPDSFSSSFSSSSSSSHATQYYYHTVRNSSKGKRSTGCRVLLLLLLQLESSHKQIIIVHRYSRLAYLLAAFDVFISFHFISFRFVSFCFVRNLLWYVIDASSNAMATQTNKARICTLCNSIKTRRKEVNGWSFALPNY